MSVVLEPPATETDQLSEPRRVIFRRYMEARDFGMTMVEARIFAEGDQDIGVLRKLVAGGCKPSLAARILN